MTRSRFGIFGVVVLGGISAAIAGTGAYYASPYLKPELVSAAMKWLTGIVALVWFFAMMVYGKMTDLTDVAGLNFKEHRNLENEVRSWIHWFWWRAGFLAVVAAVMNMPGVLTDAKFVVANDVARWINAAALIAFVWGVLSLRGLIRELEDVRRLRSHVKELERLEKAKAETLKELPEGDEPWVADTALEGFRREGRPLPPTTQSFEQEP